MRRKWLLRHWSVSAGLTVCVCSLTAGQAANTSLSSLESQMESLISLLFMISGSVALQQDVQAKLGEDVTLQCQITTDEIISVLKWSRADLNTDGYVYFYRNKRSYENYQHPSFHGRVKLRDPEMKDGDVSLILKNVTFNDTGMYECHIAVRNPGRSKRAHTEISHFINLRVTGETHNSMFEQPMTDREHGGGNMHFVPEEETPTVLMVVAAVVAAVLVVTIGGSVLLWRFKIKKQQTTEAATADLKCPVLKI